VIYLDNNATTRPDPRVVEAVREALASAFGNPSSTHAFGAAASARIEQARTAVARLIGARDPSRLTFTSGGSESIGTALCGALARAPQRKRVAATRVEHAAVLATLEHACVSGARELVPLDVDAQGLPRWDRDWAWLDEQVALVSVQWVNNETGVITPLEALRELARRCADCGAVLHVDAVQAAGKLALDVDALGAAAVSISAHKLHGPKGVGALWTRPGFEPPGLVRGGPQESGRRAGTENVAGIAGFGAASELALAWQADGGPARLAALRDAFEAELVALTGARVHGAGAPRVANTTNFAFDGVQAEALQMLLDSAGIAVSTGSACSSELQAPSHVLLAMGCSTLEATSSLRFSLSRETTREELARTTEVLVAALADLRALATG
jgi:cysteine desulfurase